MWVAIAVIALLIIVPWLAIWWVGQHPAVRGPGPPRKAPPPPKMYDEDDVWLAETYGLGFTQRLSVRIAVGSGQVVDPDNLRPIAVALARRKIDRWLAERSPNERILDPAVQGAVRAERLNMEAPPGPGPDHPSRVPPFKWTA